jgi:hypothetical protein
MEWITDMATLEEWFYEAEQDYIIPYIEKNFMPSRSIFEYEYNLMNKNLLFAKSVIEDNEMSDEEKRIELINEVRYGKSKIIMVVGSRGSGKTANALWLGEKQHEEGGHNIIYYVGTPEYSNLYPKWIKFVPTLEELPNNCFALVDEAAIRYNARDFASTENKELSKRLTILRHKGISLIIITQNIQLVEINIDRLADVIIYKMGTTYGIRKKNIGEQSHEMMQQKMMIINRLRPKTKEDVMVEYLSGHNSIFRKFTNPLPSFWDDNKISKSFQHYSSTKKLDGKQIKKQKEVISEAGIS